MDRFLAFFFLMAALVAPTQSRACDPTLRDAASDLANAQAIVVGYVTGHRHIGYERHLLSGGNPQTGQVGDVLVHVAPAEAIKGSKPTQAIEAEADCMGTFPMDRTRVVVVQIAGRYFLETSQDYEKEVRQSARRGR